MRAGSNHIIVVGGGIIGVCAAYYLARRNARVTVLERDELGKAASYGNAGTIAPGHPPINKPGRVSQAISSLLDPLSPLYVSPRIDPGLARWLWTFARTCTPAHVQAAMASLGPLGHETDRLFDTLAMDEGLDCHYRREGYYEVFLSERAFNAAKTEAAAMRRLGFHPETVDRRALATREPALGSRVLGGLYYPEAATLNPHRFLLELADRARRYGAQFRTGCEVSHVVTGSGRAQGVRVRTGEVVTGDVVVLATGAYSRHLVARLGCRLPVQPAKGYHRDGDPGELGSPALQHACVLGEASVFCTPMDGFVRLAGTLEFSGLNHDIRRPRLDQLTRAAKQYFAGVEVGESRSEWCGLRPCLPDGLPAIGPLAGYPNVIVATGHAMMGLTLGPVTGKLVAEFALHGNPSLNVQALSPGRF